jgi:Mce-associated membrane protein
VNEDESTGSSAAEMLALAEEAEAEAAEAEALAVAARARGRAIKLRRDAEVAVAKTQEAAVPSATEEVEEAAREEAAPEEAVSEKDEADSAASAPTEVAAIPEIEPDDTEVADEPADVETEESAVDAESADEADEAEDSDDEDEESVEDERPVRLPSRRLSLPRWSTIAAVVAVVVTLAALSASVYMVLGHRHATEQRQRAAEFAAAAKQGVVTLTSLDFNDAKSGVQHIVEDATGSFKDDFLKMSGDFVKVVEQSKVVSRGTVQATAVDLDTMTQDSAVVLVACTSEVTNAAGAKQDPRTYRLIVTMTREGGQLKMSKVEFVP